MTDSFTTPDHKTKDSYEVVPNSGINHLRSIRSSEGPRTKFEGVRPPPKYLLLQDHKSNSHSHEKLSGDQRFHTASSNPKYRIKTSNSAQKTRNYESRGNTAQIRGYVSNTRSQIEDLVGLQQIRGGTAVPERETHKSANRQGGPDIERLVEETVQLKRQLNQMNEENLKLKTRNSNLEKEASKLEKMFQEVSTNPRKKAQHSKMSDLNAAGFKNHLRELKDELEDRTEELNSLKKKVKVTKINELEIQLRAFQEEGMRIKARMDEVLYTKAMIQRQGEENDTEVVRLRKEFKMQEHAYQTLQERYYDLQKQVMEQEKKNKRELSVSAKNLQAKEKEIIKLKSQLIIATPPQTTTAKKTADVAGNKDEKLRKELEKNAFENVDLRGQLKEKNDYIAQLQKQLGIQSAEGTAVNAKQFLIRTPEKEDARENAQKQKAIFENPSYPRKEESPETHKKEHTKSLSNEPKPQPAEIKQAPKQEVKPEAPKQPKVSQDDVKKFGYAMNLTLRVKGKTFEDVEKLNWVKKDNTVSVSHVSEVLRNEMFGLKSEDDINLLARYLTQDDMISLIKSKLTSLIGPLPFWDEDMKKKLHLDISKTCTIYKETLEESLQLHSNGKYLTRKSLDEGAKSADLPFTFAQLEYIITKLYERSHDVNKLSIESLFEVFHFDISQHKPEESDHHKRKSQRNTSRSQAGARSNDSGKGRASKNSQSDLNKELDDVLNEYEDNKDEGDDYKPEKAYESEEENSLEEKSRDNKEDYEKGIDIISDDGEEDPDGEKYEYLFPPQGEEEEPQQEKITERGEEEEEDEYYKEQHEEEDEEVLSEEEKPAPVAVQKKKSVEKVKSEEYDDDEYKDEEYDEEPISSENRVNEEEVAEESEEGNREDHRRMGSGSEMLESRQMMESAKTNFTNTTQITEPRSDFHPFEESKERMNVRSEERLGDSPEIANRKREDRRESQGENQKRLPDITEEYDKHEEFEENFEEEEYDNDFDN